MAAEKVITMTWRDENYGRVYEAQAFRYMKDPWPSETETKKLGSMFKKHGFEVNMDRAAWIAQYQPEDACVKLVEALEEAGYTVESRGAVPDALASRPAMAM
jgi:hypothetical protein